MKKNLLFTALVTLLGLSFSNLNISSLRADNDNFFVEKNNSVLQQSDNEVYNTTDENSVEDVVSSYLSFSVGRINYYNDTTLSLNLNASYVNGGIAELGGNPVFKFGDENNKLTLTFTFVDNATYESLDQSVDVVIDTEDVIMGRVDEEDETTLDCVSSIDLTTIANVFNGFPTDVLVDTIEISNIYTNVTLENGTYVLQDEINFNNSYSYVFEEYVESPSQDLVSSLISVTASSQSRSSLSVYYRLSIRLDTNNLAYYFDNPYKGRFSVGYYGEDNFSEAKVEISYQGETFSGKVQRQVGVGTTAVLYLENGSLSTYADIKIPSYVDLDEATIRLTNIFFCDEVNNGEIYTDVPRFTNTYSVEIGLSSYIEEFDISQFIDVSTASISDFGGVRALKLKVDFNLIEGYTWLHDNGYLSAIFDYNNAMNMIKNGQYFYRGYFALSSFNQSRVEGSYFEVIYDDGSSELISNAASNQPIYDGENYLTFFLYEAKNNIKDVVIHEVSITLEVANKETDIYLRETSLGKRANLTLSNGIFDSGKSFMNFVIDRASDKGVTVSALDDSISSDEAAKIVTTYLSDLK